MIVSRNPSSVDQIRAELKCGWLRGSAAVLPWTRGQIPWIAFAHARRPGQACAVAAAVMPPRSASLDWPTEPPVVKQLPKGWRRPDLGGSERSALLAFSNRGAQGCETGQRDLVGTTSLRMRTVHSNQSVRRTSTPRATSARAGAECAATSIIAWSGVWSKS